MELTDRIRYTDKVMDYTGKGLIVALTGRRCVGKSRVMQCVIRRIGQQQPDAHAICISKEYVELNAVRADEHLNICVKRGFVVCNDSKTDNPIKKQEHE